MTKWFFALSEASLGHHDHDWPALIRAAVASAKANTCLTPIFIYDGAANGFTAELQGHGVKIIHHRLSYLGNIVQRWNQIGLQQDPMRLAIIAGAYLRTEIPNIEFEDDYVLYTDCDVMFLSDPQVERFQPEFFACAPQRYKTDYADINSGVMVMNVPAMRRDKADFYHFIVNNFERFPAFDQDALREYYKGRYEPLPLELNWKPYWGVNENANIVHFHGPKPDVVRRLIGRPDDPLQGIWRELYEQDPASYQANLKRWDQFSPAVGLSPKN